MNVNNMNMTQLVALYNDLDVAGKPVKKFSSLADGRKRVADLMNLLDMGQDGEYEDFGGCLDAEVSPVHTDSDGTYENLDGCLDAKVYRVLTSANTPANTPKVTKPRAGVQPQGELKPIRTGTDQQVVIDLIVKGSTKEEIVAALSDRKNPLGVVTQVCRMKGYGYEVVDGVYRIIFPEGVTEPWYK